MDESQILALIDTRTKEIHASLLEGGVNRMSGINDKLDLLEHKHKGQLLADIAIIQQEITKMKIRQAELDRAVGEEGVKIKMLQGQFDEEFKEQFKKLEVQVD